MSEIESLLSDLQRGHSDLQMKHFVVAKNGVTVYGQYMQSLAELSTRYESVTLSRLDIEELELDLSDVRARFDDNGCDVARTKIAERRLEIKIEAKRRSLVDQEREMDFFLCAAKRLKELVGEITDERRAALDEEFWVERCRRNLALDVWTNGRPSRGLAELVTNLPGSLPMKVLDGISDQGGAAKHLLSGGEDD